MYRVLRFVKMRMKMSAWYLRRSSEMSIRKLL